MSHSKERAEKVCLNCGADLYGRYCHGCGQENLEPKESLWGLVTHYAYDITHFDGKFFKTLKYLIARPGYLPAEYLKGRRSSYLHPIRMYVFTSAFFFIIFFSLFHVDHLSIAGNSRRVTDSLRANGIQLEKELLAVATTKKDSVRIQDKLNRLQLSRRINEADTAGKKNWKVNLDSATISYVTVGAYDSAQAALPEHERDGWLTRRMSHHTIAMYQKYNGNIDDISTAWWEKFQHLFPQLLFLSLPLFAFTLWLLYIRWNKKYYYTGHIIFTLYLYVFYFIAYLLFFALQKLHASTGWVALYVVETVLWIYMFYYMYKAMRNFYQQGWLKTILKLVLLSFASFVIIIFLFAAFVTFSVYQL